jgi:hypothetical protein
VIKVGNKGYFVLTILSSRALSFGHKNQIINNHSSSCHSTIGSSLCQTQQSKSHYSLIDPEIDITPCKRVVPPPYFQKNHPPKDATTYKGQKTIARYYNVYDKWVALENRDDKINKYYDVLLLVKTHSKKDTVWVSFIEGLHRHAATIACLLCMKFDYDNNIISLGSLDVDDFKNAEVPYYKDPEYNLRQCLLSILNGQTEAPC